MSGDWIKMRVDLIDDPAVTLIAGRTKLDAYSVVGRLHKLWSWTDKHSVDGRALTVTKAWIDEYVGRKGFADAMVDAHWLEGADWEITVPNFGRHNGETAKGRALNNRRVAGHREKASRDESDESNGPSVTPVTQPALQQHVPEKRREDKEKKRKENSPPTSRPSVTPDDPETVGPSVGGREDDPLANGNGNGYTAGDVSRRLAHVGISYHRLHRQPDRERISAWVEGGCTAAILEDAIAEASQSKPLNKLSTGYLDPIVRRRTFAHHHPDANGQDEAAVIREAMRLTEKLQ